MRNPTNFKDIADQIAALRKQRDELAARKTELEAERHTIAYAPVPDPELIRLTDEFIDGKAKTFKRELAEHLKHVRARPPRSGVFEGLAPSNEPSMRDIFKDDTGPLYALLGDAIKRAIRDTVKDLPPAGLPADERQARVEALTAEIDDLDSLLKEFDAAAEGIR